MILVQIKDLHKEFLLGSQKVEALRGVDLEYADGEMLGIRGSSGSGKTTLLNLIGGLDYPTRGQVFFDGHDLALLNRKKLTEFRAHKIGFIFQTFNLIPTLSAFENIEYPLMLLNESPKTRQQMVTLALEQVGLSTFAHHRPAQLSGGQRQRVAIARAIVKNPRLILADEPTANLDVKTAGEVLEVMVRLNKSNRTGFIFTSHDQLVLQRASRQVHLVDGRQTKD